MDWFFVFIGALSITWVLNDIKHLVSQATDAMIRMEGDVDRLRRAAETEPPRCPRCGPGSFDDLDAWATGPR